MSEDTAAAIAWATRESSEQICELLAELVEEAQSIRRQTEERLATIERQLNELTRAVESQ